MKEVMSVDMFQSLHDLEENAFDTPCIKAFRVTGFHKLIKIAVHVLHTDVKLLTERVEEYIKCRNEMVMRWKCSEEYHFSKLQTRCEGFEILLHCLDSNLFRIREEPSTNMIHSYNCAASCNI
jgi:hypothetical protein